MSINASKKSSKISTDVTNPANWNFGTKCLQAGWKPKVGEPRVLPIFQSTTYKYEDVDEVERLFALKQSGNELEGGVGAVATASGQSAVLLAISNLIKAGDHIVASKAVYGGTYTLLDVRLSKLGVETTFIDPEAPIAELRKAFRPNTKLVFGETIGNPALGVVTRRLAFWILKSFLNSPRNLTFPSLWIIPLRRRSW